MDRLDSINAFVAAVDHGSFTVAARWLRISPTMVGLHVKALEDRLGTRLLQRTTRRQNLTEAGRLFLDRARHVLADLDAAESVGSELTATPRGKLRVAAPVTLGVHALVPAIAAYAREQPEVQIELVLNDRAIDLVDEGFDVAIRVGPLQPSSLLARALTPYRMAIAASPAYLKRAGLPRTPAQLSKHNCLGFSQWHRGGRWRFETGDVPVRGSFQANNGEALRVAALEGIGVVLQPELLLTIDLQSGRLVRLLPGFALPARPVHVLHHADRRPTPKVRTFVDFIAARFPVR